MANSSASEFFMLIRRTSFAAALACCLLAPATQAAEKPLSGPIAAQVERVVDGDTLAVRARIWLGQEVRVNVRIANIDTPELRGGCAQERELAGRAQQHLRTLLHNADGASEDQVMLYDIAQDKFGGRVLARVTSVRGADLAQSLLQAGLARSYGGGKRGGWCTPDFPAIGMLEEN